MRIAHRIAAATAALALAAIPAASAVAKPATPVRPAASLTGCTVTVNSTPVHMGWSYRTTYEYCPGMGDAQIEQSCLTVEDVNPNAVPPVKVLVPRTCHYGSLRLR